MSVIRTITVGPVTATITKRDPDSDTNVDRYPYAFDRTGFSTVIFETLDHAFHAYAMHVDALTADGPWGDRLTADQIEAAATEFAAVVAGEYGNAPIDLTVYICRWSNTCGQRFETYPELEAHKAEAGHGHPWHRASKSGS